MTGHNWTLGVSEWMTRKWVCHKCGSVWLVHEKPLPDFRAWRGMTCEELQVAHVVES
ncbi:MAG: hypothetical protein BWY99_00385 [Synergistetes bacterium ADurb.BinA166]|nr:MAG: hypothetical protein BWY99_00385 [Synergistetes bacterium ADurb.BinA166]